MDNSIFKERKYTIIPEIQKGTKDKWRQKMSL